MDALTLLGRVAAAEGDAQAAQACYEESLDRAGEIGYQAALPSNLEGLATAVAMQGAFVWAANLWGVAQTLRERAGTCIPPLERHGHKEAVASTRTQLGASLFAATWSRGRALTCEQALAVREARWTVEMLPEEPSPPTRLAPPPLDGLTAREVEVLGLVAQGLTNVQIAGRLFISPRAVNTHLTSILRKIDVSTRSAATRYALEQHLI